MNGGTGIKLSKFFYIHKSENLDSKNVKMRSRNLDIREPILNSLNVQNIRNLYKYIVILPLKSSIN